MAVHTIQLENERFITGQSTQNKSLHQSVNTGRTIPRQLPILALAVVLVGLGMYLLGSCDLKFEFQKALIGDPLPKNEMYPPCPSDIPPCTSTPLPELLARYEAMLIKLGVPVESCLQKGLTDDQLNELEERYSIKLSDDIKSVYKWHNGTPNESKVSIFPLGRLLPLDYSLEIKHLPDKGTADPRMDQLMEEWLAFRKSWIEIVGDGAGNGYYFDPERINESSSFFYHVHDDVPYHFYPCVGNWILSIIDEYEQGNLEYVDGRINSMRSGSYEDEVQQINRYGRFDR